MTVRALGMVEILTDKPFLYQNSYGQPWEGGSRIQIDRCIITETLMVIVFFETLEAMRYQQF